MSGGCKLSDLEKMVKNENVNAVAIACLFITKMKISEIKETLNQVTDRIRI